MDKSTWIAQASAHLQDVSVAGWAAQTADEYAAGLYEVRAVDWMEDPAGAVDDDLSYREC